MIQMTRRICARLYPFQTKERITKGPISGMTALFGRSFEVSDRRKCHRRAARVSQVKSLSHNTHGPAEALPPTAMGFGKMDKVELSRHGRSSGAIRSTGVFPVSPPKTAGASTALLYCPICLWADLERFMETFAD